MGVRSARSVCDMVGATTKLASLVSALIENGSAGIVSGLELADESVLRGKAESDIGDERQLCLLGDGSLVQPCPIEQFFPSCER